MIKFPLVSFAHPFNYDLHLTQIPGKSSEIMIVAHGMGGTYQIADIIKIDKTLVSFNFPDFGIGRRFIDPNQTVYGTIDEILPLLYVIKEEVINKGHDQVDLYGYSAGGGAIINALAILNTNRYQEQLEKLGIGQSEKEKMLKAIQQGVVILDTPLKSLSEIIAFRGSTPELVLFAKRYQENEMEPIDALKHLEGLNLTVLVHFEIPDLILSNRDDELFFTLLKKYNPNGKNYLIQGSDGHLLPHKSLWDFYLKNFND